MHLVPRALDGIVDLHMLLGAMPMVKRKRKTGLGNLEDRETGKVAVLNRVVSRPHWESEI